MSHAQILIVEDEVIIAVGIQKKLENFGYSVAGIASSGEEALAQTIELQPDLVLMDIVIKGAMDGIAAAQRIQEQFDIPVIYLTAYSDQIHLNRAKTTAPFGYLLKPFNDRELEITLEITLYKAQVQKHIKEQQCWYSSILNSLGEAVITIDSQQTVLFINPVTEAIFHLKKEECIGRALMKVFPGETASSLSELGQWVQQALQEQCVLRKPNLCFQISDSEIVLDLCIAPLKNEAGKSNGVALVLSDKTEQSQMKQMLKTKVPELSHAEDGFTPLTFREKQVLQRMVEGEATKIIAGHLAISPRTVEFHRYNLMRKLNIHDIPSLVRYALTKQLVSFN